MAGEKLPLIVIGRSKSLSMFSGVKSLLFKYTSNVAFSPWFDN